MFGCAWGMVSNNSRCKRMMLLHSSNESSVTVYTHTHPKKKVSLRTRNWPSLCCLFTCCLAAVVSACQCCNIQLKKKIATRSCPYYCKTNQWNGIKVQLSTLDKLSWQCRGHMTLVPLSGYTVSLRNVQRENMFSFVISSESTKRQAANNPWGTEKRHVNPRRSAFIPLRPTATTINPLTENNQTWVQRVLKIFQML